MLIDWSYSQNSQLNTNNTLSYVTSSGGGVGAGVCGTTYQNLNDTQKIINEIVRKLKPYILKCVRKEVRNCFERYQQRKEHTSSKATPTSTASAQVDKKYNDNSLTKIGDF